MAQIPVITIDGPGGSGKGTVAKLIAERLHWHFLDSGALYRALGLYAEQRGTAPDDEPGLTALARDLPVEFGQDRGRDQVLLEGREVSAELRSERVGTLASKAAALPAVRQTLLQRQRDFLQPPGLVADGRDMGTVVFADAPVKIFLTASVEERARRRLKQLNGKESGATLSALSREIAERDQRDSTRATAPLKPADDAEIIDTTEISAVAVVERILAVAKSRLPVKM